MSLYLDVVVRKPTETFEGRKYITVNFSPIFSELQLDWSSGKSFAEQYDSAIARMETEKRLSSALPRVEVADRLYRLMTKRLGEELRGEW